MNTDPVADYLTRIRNANQAGLKTVEIPSSNLKVEITKILLDQGFILNYKVLEDNLQGKIKIALKYDKLTNNPDLNDAVSNQNASKSFNIIQEYLFK